MVDFMLELEGTPEEITKMLAVASRIDGAKAYKKKRMNDGLYRVWYRGKGTPNDLVAAIKRKAGLTKPKAARKAPAKKVKVEAVSDE